MRIYWYWPHAHRSVQPLCLAVMRPGDTLTVEALRPGAAGLRDDPIPEYEVVRDLPDPADLGSGRLARLTRPVRLAIGRSRARSAVVRRGFDAAHIGNLFYQTDWIDLRRLRKRVALVSDVHDVRPHRRMLPTVVETRLLRETYRNAGHLIVLHPILKDEIVADFRVAPERVHVVPHVLDASATRDPSVAPADRPSFLFFGTLRANKGLDVLSEALLALGPHFPADVVIAGGGDAETTTQLRQRLGRLAHVHLELGRVAADRKRELFSRATWVLLPYVSFHSQSGVLADAYAYRLPLIVSAVGAIGPTVRDDATGIVIPPGDPDALAAAMSKAVATEQGAFAAALDAAAARHDVSVVGPALRSIYELAAESS